MKILVVSDNHGSTNELEQIAIRHDGEIDQWIHCGDSEFAADHKLLHNYKKVKGNMDFDKTLSNDLSMDLYGLQIYVTHGHLYNVKMSFLNLYYRAEEINAALVFFGHSHIASHFMRNDIIFINPGSISLPRGMNPKSYAICHINSETNDLKLNYYDDNGLELTNLSTSYKLKGAN